MAKVTTNEKKKSEGKNSKAVTKAKKGEIVPGWSREMERFSDLFDRMTEEFWRRPFPSLWQPFRRLGMGELPLLSPPAVDVHEDDKDVVVTAEVPGLEKKDVEINLTNSRLILKGEKKKTEKKDEDGYSYKERSYGAFTRVIDLPCQVKADKAKAEFKNGVLEIRVPKTEEAQRRSYNVKID
jgi:HSP20 family protein